MDGSEWLVLILGVLLGLLIAVKLVAFVVVGALRVLKMWVERAF
jgi:4-amino-4-deoxy-L-arabinose transferase-like glycosyltransferase